MKRFVQEALNTPALTDTLIPAVGSYPVLFCWNMFQVLLRS